MPFAPAPSWLGGREEFDESRPTCLRKDATSTSSASTFAVRTDTTAASSSFRCPKPTDSTSNCSYDGGSGCDTPEAKHAHKPDASTDTPQINRGSDWLLLDRQTWTTRDQLRLAIVTWTERTYHRRRRQARLNQLTPIEFETIIATPATQAA